MADVTPVYKIWGPPKDCQDIDAALLAFVKSRNLDRRHFTAGQRALMASKLAGIKPGNPKIPQKTAEPNEQANLPIMPPVKTTQAAAAEEFKVSPRSVRVARHVQEQAAPAVVKAVEQGTMTLHAAEATIPRKPATKSPPAKKDNGTDGFNAAQQGEWRASYGKLVRMSSEWFKLNGGNTNSEARTMHAEYEVCLSLLIKLWIKANPKGRWF